MISISSDLQINPLISSVDSTFNRFLSKDGHVTAMFLDQRDIFAPHTHVQASTSANAGSIFGDRDEKIEFPKSMFIKTVIVPKTSQEPSQFPHLNLKGSLSPVKAIASKNSTCIWPMGISHQPDFIEIVVTDEEMNAFWDTLTSIF